MKKMTLILVFVSLLAVVAWGGWAKETVASAGDVGNGCCLAVDASGHPHISYGDTTQSLLMYTYYDGSEWVFETVATEVAVTSQTSLTVDAEGNPYIVFANNDTGETLYAYREEGTWVTESIYEGTDNGKYVSIALYEGSPYVTYSRSSTGSVSVSYAYRDTEGWHSEMVVTSGGEFNTLFFDSKGNPNIIYYNQNTYSVRRALYKGEEWTIDDLAEGIDPGAAIDADDVIHISFASMGNNDLTYAKSSTGGSWVIENTPGLIGDPAFTKICVNNAGDVFISYFNFANHNLRVAMKMGGKWKNELVARGDYVGLPHSPAVNGSLPMIAFYDSDTKDLKLASYDPNLGVEPGNPTDKSAGGAKGRSFALYQNAPNPVTGATTFTFELAEASTVELAIYDTAGRKVARVADGHFGPGEHDVSFTRALTPGVYVYRLDVGSESAARKMVVVK